MRDGNRRFPFCRMPINSGPVRARGLVSDKVSWSDTPVFHNTLVVGLSPTGSTTQSPAVHGGIAFALATLTYRFIERPIRFGRPTPFKAAAVTVALGTVGCAGALINLNKGFVLRWVPSTSFARRFSRDKLIEVARHCGSSSDSNRRP